MIIDQFLLNVIGSIVIEIKLFQKVRKEHFNITNEKIKKSFFYDSFDFDEYRHSSSFAKELRAATAKVLGITNLNLSYKKIKKEQKQRKINYINFFLKPLTMLYVNLFKPILIIDGYIGLKNTFYFFFRSFGKVLNIPSKLLLDEPYIDCKIDKKFRKKIKISEKDLIDKIFNEIIQDHLPVSFLEKFYFLKKESEKISQKVKRIGTGNLHHGNGQFSIIAAEILKKKGKLFVFQHGGMYSKTNVLQREHMDQSYVSKRYYFDNKSGLGQHFFNMKKISFDELKTRNSIVMVNTDTNFERSIGSYRKCSHPYLDPSQLFFSSLNDLTKKKILLKLFPQKNSLYIKKIWMKKFEKKINFLPHFLYSKKERYFDAKLVILNDISTPFYELLFLGLPFVIIQDSSLFVHFSSEFKKKIMNLKKINILFDDPAKAARFVNSFNKNSIEDWWKITSSSKELINLKKFLIVEKKGYITKIVKDLTKTK